MSRLSEKLAAALRDTRFARSSASDSEDRSRPKSTDTPQRSLRSEPARNEPGRPTKGADAVVFQAAALLLAYPEAELLDRLDVIESALRTTTVAVEQFAPVLAHLRAASLGELQAFHVAEFDLSRKHALHLSYWTDGDTRRRGEVLAEVKATYRASGLAVDTAGELPDYLPMVLEFAVADPGRGRQLLERFRASLELIRLGLEADRLPQAGVLAAVCDCLPGDRARSRAEVQARYGEVRPVELVGIEPFHRVPVGAAPATLPTRRTEEEQ